MDDIVENILKERYYQPGETCWEDIAWRVSKFIGKTESEQDYFNVMIRDKYVVPASPFLMNAGTEHPQCFSCFTLNVDDDIRSIFKFYADASLVFKSSGGIGVNWSKLRPKGSSLSGGGFSSGVLSFMNIFNELIETVSQGGKKKGAAICLLSTEHPECEDFIRSKLIEGKYKNFNISPVITDQFMERAITGLEPENKMFNLIVDCTYNSSEPGALFIDTINRDSSTPGLGEYNEVNPCVTGDTLLMVKVGKDIKIIPIKDLINKDVDVWNGYEWTLVTPMITGYNQPVAEVGVVLESNGYNYTSTLTCTLGHKWLLGDDTRVETTELKVGNKLKAWIDPLGHGIRGTISYINKLERVEPVVYCFTDYKNHSGVFNGILTAQCGERPLLPYESCCLMAIVLPKFVKGTKIDVVLLDKIVRKSIRFLDNSMDVNEYPIPEIKEATLKTRRLGLYITGFADTLVMLGIKYGSKECIDFIEDIWGFINKIAWQESVNIGIELGTFPAYYTRNPDIVPDYARNAAVTCLAPSGTTSIIAGVNWGIEPFYSYASVRSEGAGQGFIVNKLFEEMLDTNYPDKKEQIIEHCAKHGTIQNIPYISKEIKDVFVTALDLSYKEHIDVQSAFQKYCHDGSISKTLNMPKTSTLEDVRNAYIYAWRTGCKGITFYREGTRKGVYQLKNEPEIKNPVEKLIKNPVQYKLLVNPTGRILAKTPREIPSITYKRSTGCGKMMITIGEVNGKPHTIVIKNKGGCDAMTQAVAELTSLCERYEVPQWNTNKVLMGIRCPAAMKNPKSDGKSCAEILGKILNDFYPHEDEPPKDDEEPPKATPPIVTIEYIDSTNVCPDCGEPLTHEGGCVICKNCAYSKCG